MSKIPDVHSQKPVHTLPLMVGAEGLTYNYMLKIGKSCIPLTLKANILISLSPFKRGAHISRIVRALEEAIGDPRKCETPYDTAIRIAKTVLRTYRETDKVVVSLETDIYIKDQGQEVHLSIEYVLKDNQSPQFITRMIVTGATACPSAGEVYRHAERDNTPLTHMQRAQAEAIIRTEGAPPPDPSLLATRMLEGFSAPLKRILRRIEEYELVKKASVTPRFTEDVARAIASGLRDLLAVNTKHGVIEVNVKSFESIHPFNITAKTVLRW